MTRENFEYVLSKLAIGETWTVQTMTEHGAAGGGYQLQRDEHDGQIICNGHKPFPSDDGSNDRVMWDYFTQELHRWPRGKAPLFARKKVNEMKGVLTTEQAVKIATMMLYAADYRGSDLYLPALHIGSNAEENTQMIASALTAIFNDIGIEKASEQISINARWGCVHGMSLFIGEDKVNLMRKIYGFAPIYTDRKGQQLTLYRGVYAGGTERTINTVYVDAYERTDWNASTEKMDAMIRRHEREIENYYYTFHPVNEGRLNAEQQNRERIKDYNERKDTFCHGIGQRRVKLFLNKLVKEGDAVSKMYRIALEIEGVNLAAKKALMKYHSDYHSYDRKEAMLRELMEVCRAEGATYGQQRSTAPAATHVIYFDLPGCEQISFHTNMHEAASLPAYSCQWDGKRCSTMGKLEAAIWARYEQALREKYKIDE